MYIILQIIKVTSSSSKNISGYCHAYQTYHNQTTVCTLYHNHRRHATLLIHCICELLHNIMHHIFCFSKTTVFHLLNNAKKYSTPIVKEYTITIAIVKNTIQKYHHNHNIMMSRNEHLYMFLL